MTSWLLTSSWDDGDPLDMRLAERLVRAGWGATFYLCRNYEGRPRLADAEIIALGELPGVEIGAHTLTHPDLRRVSAPRLVDEVTGSRRWLEDLLGREVTAFCYPKGLHNRRAARAVAAAGYRLGRTTLAGLTAPVFDRFMMPTTMQFFPHSRLVQLRHALKERNARGALRIATLSTWPNSPARLAGLHARAASPSESRVLHFWGHSWELEQHDLWGELELMIQLMDTHDVEHLTNTAVVDRLGLCEAGT